MTSHTWSETQALEECKHLLLSLHSLKRPWCFDRAAHVVTSSAVLEVNTHF